MKDISNAEIKNIQLEILVQFRDYCEANNLQYFLYAGTLLGAIRHQGFIPWDDDIDVVMPRPDYEKFFQLSMKKPIGKYLQTNHYSIRKHYNAPFIKLVDTRTDGHEMFLDKNITSGVWIDVFPLDGAPSDPIEQKRYIKLMQKKRRVLELSSRPLIFCSNPLRFMKRLLVYICYHPLNYHRLAKNLDRLASTTYLYNKSQFVGVMCFCEGKNEIVPRAIFEKVKKVSFEGLLFNSPLDSDLYLKNLYGDYMVPPPPEERIYRHQYFATWRSGYEQDHNEDNL